MQKTIYAHSVISLLVFLLFSTSHAYEELASLSSSLRFSDALIRPELVKAGEHILVDVDELCQKIQCNIEVSGGRYWRIEYQSKGVIWDKESPQTLKLIHNHHAYDVQLPLSGTIKDQSLFLPIRILVETMGFNSLYYPDKEMVKIFQLKDNEQNVQLRLVKKIEGSSAPVSYFVDSIEYEKYIYLVFDYSYELFRFDKANNMEIKKYPIDKKYGILRKFEDLGQGRIVVLTEKGYLFQFRDEKLKLIGGGGKRVLNVLGQQDRINNIQFKSLNFISKSKDGSAYLLDTSDLKLYRLSRDLKTVTYVYNIEKWNWVLDLVSDENDPVIFSFDRKKSSITKLDSSNKYKPQTSPCTQKIFENKRIYGGLPVGKGEWVFLDSASREIVEARFNFSSAEGGCKITQKVFTGNETAFLNNFGQSFVSDVRKLIIDSDGFNLVRYKKDKTVDVVQKNDLFKKLVQRWIAPVSLAQLDSDLLVLGNLSHQVYRLSAKTDYSTGEVFLGIGKAERRNIFKEPKETTAVGFPSYLTVIDGSPWVADHFGRRLLYVEKGQAIQPFPPPSHLYMSGISGMAKLNNDIYLTDPIFGQVFQFVLPTELSKESSFEKWVRRLGRLLKLSGKLEKIVPVAGQFSEEVLKDSEVYRRNAASTSIENMTSFNSVVFGFPQSIVKSHNEKLYVSDIYRHGIWELDPITKKVRTLAGFKTLANYHFGSVNGNIGFPGQYVRLNSPGILEYDEKHEMNIIPSVYGQKVILANKDFSKTCEAKTDEEFKAVFQAILLKDKKLAVADSVTHNIYIYDIVDDSCLSHKLPVKIFKNAL